MELTKSLLYSPKTMAEYKVDAKKSIKSKLTVLAIIFFGICAVLQSLNWITPLLIKIIALSIGATIVYLLYKEIINLKQVGSVKLDDELKQMGYDDSAMQTIQAIQKTRNVCNLDLQLIKTELSKNKLNEKRNLN